MRWSKGEIKWNRGILTCLGVFSATIGLAQTTYRIGENSSAAESGPVRMARVTYETGPVEWRPTEKLHWSKASYNMPLRQGAEIWVPSGGRAEVQFDDGSDLRLASGAVVQLSTLYSDDQGEFTEIKLSDGLATLYLMNGRSLYQVDTPDAAIKAYGPAEIRVGDTTGLEVAVQRGQAIVTGTPGNLTLNKGQYVDITDPNARYTVERLPKRDSWDAFNYHRDEVVYRPHHHLPHTLALTADDLDDYGTWHYDRRYGDVWAPSEPADWRPYEHGAWTWVSPFGWTWVANEPWGWDPYHYGTWVREPWGWSWDPGPPYQPWSPAVVDFTYYNGDVAWAPLAPWEVSYPAAFSIGFGFGNWGFSFSIGSVGCYYPVGAYCAPYCWNNAYANGFAFVYDSPSIYAYYRSDPWLGRSFGPSRFYPANARLGGAVFGPAASFGNGGGFRPLDPARTAFFSRGQSFMDPSTRSAPLSGPFNVRPSGATAFTASHRFSSSAPDPRIANRSVFRGSLPSTVARRSSFAGTTAMSNRTGRSASNTGPGMTGSFGRAQTISRPNQAGSANSGTPGTNRYNRFNSISRSPFTRNVTAGRSGPARSGTGSSMRAAQHFASSQGSRSTTGGRNLGSQRGGISPRNLGSTHRTTATGGHIGSTRSSAGPRTSRRSFGRTNGGRTLRSGSIPRSSGGNRRSFGGGGRRQSFGGSQHFGGGQPRSFSGGRSFGGGIPRSFGGGQPRSFGSGAPRSFGGGQPRSFGGGRGPGGGAPRGGGSSPRQPRRKGGGG